jgi:hypothetical protein
MTTKLTVVLALAAGFIGGLASHYCVPSPVFAQQGSGSGIPEKTSIPQEIQAHKFLLVDEGGAVRGAFGFEKDGTPNIEIIDLKGHKWGVWREHTTTELLPDLAKNGTKPK